MVLVTTMEDVIALFCGIPVRFRYTLSMKIPDDAPADVREAANLWLEMVARRLPDAMSGSLGRVDAD